MAKIKRRVFTLLEIMVALTILSLIGTLTAAHISKLIAHHAFEKEASDLFISLQEAQILASAYQTDISLDITQESGKLFYQFSSHEQFTPQQLKPGRTKMKQIALVKFQEKKVKQLHLDIFSGRLEPRGILTFYQTAKENSKTAYVDLQRGHLLKFSYHKLPLVKQQMPIQP